MNNSYNEQAQQEAIKSIKESPLSDQKKAIKLMKSNNDDNVYKLFQSSDIWADSFKEYMDMEGDKLTNNEKEFENIIENLYTNESNMLSNSVIDKLKNLSFNRKDNMENQASHTFKSFSELSKSLAFDDKSYNNMKNFFNQKIAMNDENSEMYESLLNYIETTVFNYKEEYDTMKSRMLTFLQSKNAYWNLNDEQRTLFDSVIRNLSEEDYNNYSKNEKSLIQFLNNYSQNYKNSSNNISTLINSQSLLDSSSTNTVSEIKKKIKESKTIVGKQLGLNNESITKIFNIDDTIINEPINKIIKFYS